MNLREKQGKNEVRMLDAQGLCDYLSMGKTRATEYAEKWGAKRKLGKRTLYDKKIIDKVLDELESEEETNE